MADRNCMILQEFSEFRLGGLQRSGPLGMVPVFGPDHGSRFVGPLSGVKLAGVKGYGNVELENPKGSPGVAIVPLHIGYIQDQAQNHALCRSGFIAPGQKVMFSDACCVQAGQGGFLAAAEQWFFVLPLALRPRALELRGKPGYSKLWNDIAQLNVVLGMSNRGHLEEIVCRTRPFLIQYANRLERLNGQTGAIFFLGDELVGIELAPSPEYFAELWTPITCFCYGVSAMQMERASVPQPVTPLPATDLAGLARCLAARRQLAQDRLTASVNKLKNTRFRVDEDEKYLELSLRTVTSSSYAGQVVFEKDRLIYASIFAQDGLLTSPKPSLN